jgi:hypothetical protein
MHGAIRPNNVLLTQTANGEPRMIGFEGHILQPPATRSLEDAAYIAPEQAQGYTENARSDIYSLGVILYEMTTGTTPFQGDTSSDVMMQQIHAAPQSPALINPNIRPALTAIIMRCLAKDPSARFPNASAIITMLGRAFNISTQDVLSQSGSWLALQPNWPLSAGPNTGPNSPNYMTPLPQTPGQFPQPAQSAQASSAPPVMSPSLTPKIASPETGGMPVLPSSARQDQQQWSQPHPAINSAHTPTITQQPPALPSAPVPPPSRRGRIWLAVILVLLALVVAGSTLAVYVLNLRNQGSITQDPIVGHAFFVSSGQTQDNSAFGIADRLQIDLQNIPNPAPGKSYYMWLLADTDTTDTSSIMLGAFTHGGRIDVAYPGNAQHQDLLATYSRFLITEENAGSPPSNPSLDKNAWRYYAAFSQVKTPGIQFSLLDHLRHLLAKDPKLQAVGLQGGLDTWLFHNTLQVLEEAGSIRDVHDAGGAPFMRRQLIRMLDYLDSSQYVVTENLPPDLAGAPVLINPTEARVALLEFDEQNQNPPGYLKHIGNHLREVVTVPNVTEDQKALANQINQYINNAQGWLTDVHKDATTLIHMPPDQLLQPSTTPILDDMFTKANYAFVGQTDPNTNQVKGGVVEIHYSIQRLATFDIRPYQAGSQ